MSDGTAPTAVAPADPDATQAIGPIGDPPPPSTPPRPLSWPAPPAPPVRPADPAPEPQAADPSRQREHWLAVSVAVVAALVVAAGIALAVSQGGSAPPIATPSPAPSTAVSAPHVTQPPSAQRPGRSGHTGRAGSSRTTTSVAPPAVAGGPPVISSLSPSSGSAGQGVQVAGANFLSSNGQIVATFNGQVASTSCPAQNSCTITVPPMTGASSAQVTITTAGGTSNAVTFTYS